MHTIQNNYTQCNNYHTEGKPEGHTANKIKQGLKKELLYKMNELGRSNSGNKSFKT